MLPGNVGGELFLEAFVMLPRNKNHALKTLACRTLVVLDASKQNSNNYNTNKTAIISNNNNNHDSNNNNDDGNNDSINNNNKQ